MICIDIGIPGKEWLLLFFRKSSQKLYEYLFPVKENESAVATKQRHFLIASLTRSVKQHHSKAFTATLPPQKTPYVCNKQKIFSLLTITSPVLRIRNINHLYNLNCVIIQSTTAGFYLPTHQ